MRKNWVIGLAVGGLAACASVVGDTESTVHIRTTPDNALCALKGQGGYAASVASPGSVTVPHTASPVTVTCTAPGFRPTANTLTASADGWVWGNSALIFGTAGVMVLGAMIDESRGAGKAYAEEVEYKLEPDRPRPVNVRTRGGEELKLKAR
ncbi:MAG TPA: hypothetical protein VLL76_03770 [Candidatus Omnitrophota bacterium]|nr:hypothetical protein [Candidatus Omnitrophota bacterium]